MRDLIVDRYYNLCSCRFPVIQRTTDPVDLIFCRDFPITKGLGPVHVDEIKSNVTAENLFGSEFEPVISGLRG